MTPKQPEPAPLPNADPRTVADFGAEWSKLTQSALEEKEARQHLDAYFRVFPWEALPSDATGFDMGCGSGRWAKLVSLRVGSLLCIDASEEALRTAQTNLHDRDNCTFRHASASAPGIPPASMDFGYSLGVLHHMPDTESGLRACAEALKPGAPFLVYFYYDFDNRRPWFRALWKLSDHLRRLVCRLPFKLKYGVTQVISALVYWPLARSARLLERLGMEVESFPLSIYRRRSFFSMRTDALDRFGTRLEHRFTRQQIQGMMERSGLERIVFSDAAPYWCAVGFRGSGE